MMRLLWKSACCLAIISLSACQLILPDVSEQTAQEAAVETEVQAAVFNTGQPDVAPVVAEEPSVAETILVEATSAETSVTEPAIAEAITEEYDAAEKVESDTFVVEPDVAEPEKISPAIVASAPVGSPAATASAYQSELQQLCHEIGSKLGSVSLNDCLRHNLQYAAGFSVNKRILASREFIPSASEQPVSRILIMGGIHGDEYSSISIMFKWMDILAKQSDSQFHWRFLPLVNPDGLLDGRGKRQNANGVDLNRNFPSADWEATAIETWKKSTGSNPRRFPGSTAASEPETQWLIKQIEDFDPVIIVSVHAPHDLLDFDGPIEPPRRIGQLYLHQLGVYPGSLGNWGGLDLGIPVVTLELPSAGIMPSKEQIQIMWDDLHNWLNANAPELTAAQSKRENIAAD